MIPADHLRVKLTGDKIRRTAPARLSNGTVSVRILLLQTLAHAVIFAGQSAGGFAERALLAAVQISCPKPQSRQAATAR